MSLWARSLLREQRGLWCSCGWRSSESVSSLCENLTPSPLLIGMCSLLSGVTNPTALIIKGGGCFILVLRSSCVWKARRYGDILLLPMLNKVYAHPVEQFYSIYFQLIWLKFSLVCRHHTAVDPIIRSVRVIASLKHPQGKRVAFLSFYQTLLSYHNLPNLVRSVLYVHTCTWRRLRNPSHVAVTDLWP